MEYLRIETSTELFRVRPEEIAYIKADGNYSTFFLIGGFTKTLTFQLHYMEAALNSLQDNTFVRVGRSLIVNKIHIRSICVPEQTLVLGGKEFGSFLPAIKVAKEPLQSLKESLKGSS
jgi:DNA-binding LytR/AlgR family response regulator